MDLDVNPNDQLKTNTLATIQSYILRHRSDVSTQDNYSPSHEVKEAHEHIIMVTQYSWASHEGPAMEWANSHTRIPNCSWHKVFKDPSRMIKPTRLSKVSGADTKIHPGIQTKSYAFINRDYPHCYCKCTHENHEKVFLT